MRTNLLLVAAVLAAAMPVSAQYVTRPQPSFGLRSTVQDGKSAQNGKPTASAEVAAPDAAAGCPVAMRAERRTTFGVIQAKSGGHETLWQRIYLEIDRDSHTVVEAKVTVHGTRAQARMTPVLSTSIRGAKDAVKSFTLRPGSADSENLASDLRLEGFTSVQSVSLDAVTYADGSTWTAHAAQRCSVEPDPLMLISAR